jgi:hypothetical protein
LATVLGRPRRADVKNGVKNYHGPTTSLENTENQKIGLRHAIKLN